MAIEHKNIPDSELHEPKGIAGASSNTTYVADGAGSGTYKDLSEVLRMGLENYDATSSPLSLTTSDQYLENDGAGPNTILTYKLSDVGNTWDTVTDSFDFTDYNPGDWIDMRLDLDITTGVNNQVINIAIEMASGDAGEFDLNVASKYYRDSGTYNNEIFLVKVFIGSAFVRDNPAKLKISSSDAAGSVDVNGWALKTLKKGLV